MKNLFFLIAFCAVSNLFAQTSAPAQPTVEFTVNAPNTQALHYKKDKAVKFKKKGVLQKVGKVYYQDNQLFINEPGRGVHVFDNSNPRKPKFQKLIQIADNTDIAILHPIMYADSGKDLLVINLQTEKTLRLANIFSAKASSNASSKTNLSRFCVVSNHLYVLDQKVLKVFNLMMASHPQQESQVALNVDVETLSAYQNNLYISSSKGVYIYDISKPIAPIYVSTLQNASQSTPFTVQNNMAFVAEQVKRNNSDNQMNIIDLANIKAPKTLKSQGVSKSLGISARENYIYLCHENNIEIYEVTGTKDLRKLTSAYLAGVYGVIAFPNSELLIVVTSNGIHQFRHKYKLLESLSTVLITGKGTDSTTAAPNETVQ